jgi:type I restriction enzyme S subunit
MSWKNVSLADLALPTGGSFVDGPFGSNLKASEYEADGVPIIRLQNVRPNEFLSKDIKFISQRKAGELLRHSYSPGDVVISKLGDPPGYACVVPNTAGSGIIVADVVRFRGDPTLIDHHYLSFYLNSPLGRQQFLKLSKGTTRTRVNLTNIKSIDIPLPTTLDEQKRIAAVLDKVDALRRQRQESLQLTEQLLQSVFIDMFVRNPDTAEWTPQSVEWMAKDAKGAIRTGPFGSQLLHSEFVDRGIAVLGIDNAVKNRFEWGQPRRFITPEKYQGLKRYKVFPGDLIITIMGTLGRCAVVPDDIPESINTKHLCCITLDQQKCLPEFLHAAFLNHPDVLRQLGVRTKGAVMPGLNMGIIKGLEIPLPPVELQREFRRIVALCTISRTDLEISKVAVDELFSAIQQRAFRGELDLSRLVLAEVVEPAKATDTTAVVANGRYRRPGSFIAPPEIEAQMMALEHKLDVDPGDTIAWDENYFKYRTLSQVLQPPFSFSDIWEAVENDMEEVSYDTVKDKIFEYVEKGTLEQQFDEARKEIVFYPRA